MLFTSRKCFRINNVSFSSTMASQMSCIHWEASSVVGANGVRVKFPILGANCGFLSGLDSKFGIPASKP